jgi:hypothetical protein
VNIWILTEVESLTGSYHAGGGLAVVAADEPRARALVAEKLAPAPDSYEAKYGTPPKGPTDAEWSKAVRYPLGGPVPESVYIFPDSGCC